MGPLRFGRYPLIHLIHPILCSLARWPVWLRAKLWWPANKGPYVDSCSRMKLAAGWKLCLAWQKPTGIAVCRQRRGLAPFGRLAPRPAPAMEWKQRNSSLFFFSFSLSLRLLLGLSCARRCAAHTVLGCTVLRCGEYCVDRGRLHRPSSCKQPTTTVGGCGLEATWAAAAAVDDVTGAGR